jgi:hypothetical protein
MCLSHSSISVWNSFKERKTRRPLVGALADFSQFAIVCNNVSGCILDMKSAVEACTSCLSNLVFSFRQGDYDSTHPSRFPLHRAKCKWECVLECARWGASFDDHIDIAVWWASLYCATTDRHQRTLTPFSRQFLVKDKCCAKKRYCTGAINSAGGR